MKLKMKPYIHYAPTSEGVYFKTWTKGFVLKGKGLFSLIEQITPRLDGNSTFDELIQSVNVEQVNVTRQIISQLLKIGIIEYVENDEFCMINDNEKRLYKQTLNYMKEYFDKGYHHFKDFRKSKWLIIGSGYSFKAAVRALLKMGLSNIMLPESEITVLNETINYWSDKDPDLNITWFSSDISPFPELKKKIFDFVLYISDDHDESLSRSLVQVCRKSQIDLLIATVLGEDCIIGPIMDKNSKTTWSCLLERIHLNKETRKKPNTISSRILLGNLTVIEAFKHQINDNDYSTKDKIITIDPLKMSRKHRSLIHMPESKKQDQYTDRGLLGKFKELTNPLTQRDFLERLEIIKDEKIGILTFLHPDNLLQIPLAHARAVVHLPNTLGNYLVSIVSSGETIDDALEFAACESLGIYAEKVYGSSYSSNFSASSSWVIGRYYDEWLGKGLLSSLANISIKENKINRHLYIEDLNDRASYYLKILTIRYNINVQIVEIDSILSCVHIVLLYKDGVIISKGIGRDCQEAIISALLKAVSYYQLLEKGKKIIEDIESRRNFAQKYYLKDRFISWRDWKIQVLTKLKELNIEVRILPAQQETFFYDLGLLTGCIEVCIPEK